MVNTPYAHIQLTALEFERTFDVNVHPHELVWHRDHNMRQITVMEGSGWCFQFDNQLPFQLTPQQVFEVQAGVYHRLIKGHSMLKLRISESESKHQV